jgi:hypothetical protein
MGINTMTGKRSVCYAATAQCGNSEVTFACLVRVLAQGLLP